MRLRVFLGSTLVGHLDHDSTTNRFAFAYEASWLAADDSFPLAPALPLQPAPDVTADAHGQAVRIFFENLLPEGQALDDAAKVFSISKANVTGLLSRLGRETAGALRLLPLDDNEPAAPDTLRAVSREELSLRIRQRAEQPFSVWDHQVRLSIAGYQDKLAVYEDAEGSWHLADGPNLASTHILKPESVNKKIAGLPANELLCMRLAEAVGLSVAPVALCHVPEPVLQVTRFDRRLANGQVLRLPVIDGCQALGLAVGAKYERPYGSSRDVRDIRAGASLPQLFALLQRTARPLMERLGLLRWLIFQVLSGNTDAHAKNLSFFTGPEGLRLAPAYDLVCTRIYGAAVDGEYAMAIGDAFLSDELSAYEWLNFAESCGLPPALVKKEIARLAGQALAQLPKVSRVAVEEGADPGTIARIGEFVCREAERLQEMARRM